MKRKLMEILEVFKSCRMLQMLVKKSKKVLIGLKKVILKFELCWKYYVKGVGFKIKRFEQEGGVRVVDFLKDVIVNDCFLELKNIFFLNGVSFLGSVDEVEFMLVDFKCQKINMGDNFLVESYKKENCFNIFCLFFFIYDIGLLLEEFDNEDLMEFLFDLMSQRDMLFSNFVFGIEQSDFVGSILKEVKNLESLVKENE